MKSAIILIVAIVVIAVGVKFGMEKFQKEEVIAVPTPQEMLEHNATTEEHVQIIANDESFVLMPQAVVLEDEVVANVLPKLGVFVSIMDRVQTNALNMIMVENVLRQEKVNYEIVNIDGTIVSVNFTVPKKTLEVKKEETVLPDGKNVTIESVEIIEKEANVAEKGDTVQQSDSKLL